MAFVVIYFLIYIFMPFFFRGVKVRLFLFATAGPVWRLTGEPKSRTFSPGRSGYEKVLRTSISATSKDLGRKPRRNAMKMDIRVDVVAFKHPNHCLLLFSMSSSTFFMRLLPRAESATFLLSTQSRPSVNKARMKSRDQMLGHFNAQKKTPEVLFMALSCLSTFFIPRSTRAASATFVQVLDRHN
jgi:hypothetical protein